MTQRSDVVTDLTTPTSPPSRVWRAIAALEVLLACVVVGFDVFVPTLVLLAIAGASLALRRASPASLGFHRSAHPRQLALRVLLVVAAWTVVQLAVVMPVLEHLTGERQDLSQFDGLQGDLGLLAGFLLVTWTLAAVGEELVYRGYVPTRVADVMGPGRAGLLSGVLVSSVLFGLAHTEQGVIGVAVTFLDALVFSALRIHYRTVWASVLAHGFNNTIGLVAVYFVGPIYGLW